MKDLTEFDFTATIREYDFTKKTMLNMNRVLDSETFAEMDADAIFDYLMKEMEIVSFGDYLKRYIFNKAEIEGDFNQLSDADYETIILDSFIEKGVPLSFQPTSRKNNTILKSWVEKGQISREGVFVLGFGLGMSDGDVSEFLTKVLKEDDFDFSNVRETIFWHCYHNEKSYSDAERLISIYENLPADQKANEVLWTAMTNNPKIYLVLEKSLVEYLGFIKSKGIQEERNQIRHAEFMKLYERVCDIISELDEIEAEVVTPSDVENVICCGIPLTSNGNLQKMSLSLLSDLFSYKRLTRQRITKLIKNEAEINRYDIITLIFYIYSETVEQDWPTERTIKFIEEVNETLNRCSMWDIYPVNAYEAFVLMCMLTECPLDVYSEVWEKSYSEF